MEKFEHKNALKYNNLRAFIEFLRREREMNFVSNMLVIKYLFGP